MSITAWFAAKTAGWTLKSVGSTILRSWITWVGLAVFIAFTSLWLRKEYLYDQIHNEKTGYIVQLQNKQADIAVCEVQNVQLKATIAEQNQSIQEWKDRGEELEERSRIQQGRIDELDEANRLILDQIDEEEIGESCEDAMRWLLAKAIEMQNENN